MIKLMRMKFPRFFVFLSYFLIFQAALAASDTEKNQQKTVRLGYFNSGTPFMSYSPNSKSGYGYEYLQATANIAGWKYEYKYGSFSKLYSDLKKGKIDILAGVTKTEERKDEALFPDEPMGTEETTIFIREGDKRFSNFSIELFNGKTVAVDKSNASFKKFQDFLSKNKISCKITGCSDEPDLSKSYNNTEADAVLDSSLFSADGWKPAVKISSQDFYIAVSKSRPDILQDLNSAQEIIKSANPFFQENLREKYYHSIILPQAAGKIETEWLKKHYYQIKVGCMQNDAPFAFYSKESQKAEGALVDFLKATVSALDLSGTSLNFVFFGSHDEMMDALKNGEVDIVFPVPSDYYLAENKNYMISGTVFKAPLSLLYKETKSIGNFQRIALWDSGAAGPYLKKYYPRITPVYLDSKSEALNAVFSRKYDASLADSYAAETALKTDKRFKNIKTFQLDDVLELSLALRKSSTGLLSIIKKGMTVCDEDARHDMIFFQQSRAQENSSLKKQKSNAGVVFFQLAFTALLIAIIIYEFLMLQRYSGCESVALVISKKKLASQILDAIKKNKDSNLPLCLFIGRIENYREIKKAYGSKCAKKVFFQLAKASMTERTSAIFRSGKSEVVVLSHKSASEIRQKAENGSKEILEDGIMFKNRKVKIKISFGISEYKTGIMPLQLYALADRNLFDSKNDLKAKPRF